MKVVCAHMGGGWAWLDGFYFDFLGCSGEMGLAGTCVQLSVWQGVMSFFGGSCRISISLENPWRSFQGI